MVNSEELSSSGGYSSWREEQISKKQQQRESNIAAKANEKKELTQLVRQQNDELREATKNREKQIDKFLDIFKSATVNESPEIELCTINNKLA